jgi:hypothetical protein
MGEMGYYSIGFRKKNITWVVDKGCGVVDVCSV